MGQVFTLLPARNVLGRGADPDITIVLPWTHVSRRQALIEFFSPGTWEIEDLTSRNGTYVNGQKLQPRTLVPLNEGDRINVTTPGAGTVEFLFTFQLTPSVSREEARKHFLGPNDLPDGKTIAQRPRDLHQANPWAHQR